MKKFNQPNNSQLSFQRFSLRTFLTQQLTKQESFLNAQMHQLILSYGRIYNINIALWFNLQQIVKLLITLFLLQIKMSNNSNKPITAAFELETKIRTIIQELLAATVRKLATFHQKVDKFQDYFIIYKQNIQNLEKKSQSNGQSISSLTDITIKNKQELRSHIIKVQEKNEHMSIKQDQMKQQLKEAVKKINIILRQNQTMSNELSKTKSKFLQYSEQISALKQQVAWKISKYLQDTMQVNTDIKINNQAMKNQYSSVILALDKQREKYEAIIQMNEQQSNKTRRMHESIQQINAQIEERSKQIKKIQLSFMNFQSGIANRLKMNQGKTQAKISQIYEKTSYIKQSVKKVDDFSYILQQLKSEQEKNFRMLLKKIEESGKMARQSFETEILNLNKEKLKSQKIIEKRFDEVEQKQEKLEQHLTQKLQFVKNQVQMELMSKASAMLQQKSQKDKNIASDSLQGINDRINKITIQTQKSISKVQVSIKEVKKQIKKQISEFNQNLHNTIDNRIVHKIQSGQLSSSGENRNQLSLDSSQLLQNLKKNIQSINEKIINLESQSTLLKTMEEKLKTLGEELSEKVQKVMFLVTKMRGDSIIRNQYTDKEIKEIKKWHYQGKRQVQYLVKLTPAMGEMINVIMCLIFDAQYQHSKIIQDNLPQLQRDIQKFNTVVQGVLYEFRQKKKPGIVYYRHKQVKKTDIVKASFWGYLSLWEQIFEGQGKNKQNLLPKNFYKKYVQKNIGLKNPKKFNEALSPPKQSTQLLGSNQSFNQSFHIRKKKAHTMVSKESFGVVQTTMDQ